MPIITNYLYPNQFYKLQWNNIQNSNKNINNLRTKNTEKILETYHKEKKLNQTIFEEQKSKKKRKRINSIVYKKQ